MIIVIAGMQRSGSTFSFNVVREILESRGSVKVVSTNSLLEALDSDLNSDHLIIKTHAPDELMNILIAKKAIKCVCTYRKPEDAVVSWMKVFGFSLDESVRTIASWLEWHSLMCRNVFNLPYGDIDKWPLLAIYRIGKALVGGLSWLEVIRIWRRYRKKIVKIETEHLPESGASISNIGFSYYDTQTFFHRRHISSMESIPADQQLTYEELMQVRYGLRNYTDSLGNYLPGTK